MARETIAGEKEPWERDIDDLEHKKKHLENELDEMLRSDDINIAVDEDAHEEVRQKIQVVVDEINKIREENANKDAPPKTDDDDDDDDEEEEEKIPPDFLTFDIEETKKEWRDWKRDLPKEPYVFTKGFKRQCGGNGTLAHEAETTTEAAIEQAMLAHKKMQAVRRVRWHRQC